MISINPVTDFQSSQYAARTIGEIESAQSYISGARPVFSVDLNRKQEERRHDNEFYADINSDEENHTYPFIAKSTRNKQVPMHVLQKAVEITGKGKFVNKYI
ncbi:hypothetical protein JOC77_002466 [Peribacillus deserti]|uniref:Uncharacterized protein n=1 Tax=Peribacillus deserti TaxID=673318 RepID=A0ABS2QIW4_9BACI|nr:hypothetical protein [Peribacillus deserti]MBM7693027.1 hypothetical protein [Peribacillus deserti]